MYTNRWSGVTRRWYTGRSCDDISETNQSRQLTDRPLDITHTLQAVRLPDSAGQTIRKWRDVSIPTYGLFPLPIFGPPLATNNLSAGSIHQLKLSGEQARIFREIFMPAQLSPVHFLRLMDVAERRVMLKGNDLNQEGRPHEEVFLIVDGTAEVCA